MTVLKLITNENYISRDCVITLTQAMPAHIRELANNLQAEDKKEQLTFGVTPEKALFRSYKNSIIRRVGLIDGKVAAIWGVGGAFMGTKGTPWLLTSPEIRKISPLKFTRIYQQELQEMLNLFPVLENSIPTGYTAAIRLLHLVGFEVGMPELVGEVSIRKFRVQKQ